MFLYFCTIGNAYCLQFLMLYVILNLNAMLVDIQSLGFHLFMNASKDLQHVAIIMFGNEMDAILVLFR